MKRVLEKQARQQSAMKRKRYTNFSDTDRAEIGQYTAIFVATRLLVKLREGLREVHMYCLFTKIRSQIT